tara:strand:- start:4899 stop:5231 length:333 start_codon:yes stop_codon:yes gene_type:complete
MSNSIKAIYSVGHTPGKPFIQDEDGYLRTSQRVLAIEGRVRVVGEDWDGNVWRDKVMVDPSFGSMRGAATRQIRGTNNGHNIFFEGFYFTGEETDKQGRTVKLITLIMGS